MKPARLIVLGVALVAGGTAAFLARGGRQPEPPKQAAQLATIDVLVAKSDLGVGHVIGGKDIGWQSWPAAAAGKNFIKRTERPDAVSQFVGALVRMPVAAGEPIRDTKVVTAKGGYMAAILPHGMRAISLDVAPDTDAGGFILPNDHVDIVLTRRDKAAEKRTGVEKFVSETILKNVRVLAVDQNVEEKNGQKVVVGKTATIELTPQQTEVLALSRQLGTISLALRSLLDSQSPTPESGEVAERKDDAGAINGAINTVRYGVTTQMTPR